MAFGLLLSQSSGSRGHRLSSCSTSSLAVTHGLSCMWIKSRSPALKGGFLITGPSGMSPSIYLFFNLLTCLLLLLFGCTGSSPRHSGLSLVAESGGCSLVAEHALLLAVASLVAEPRFQARGLQQLHHVGSAAVVHVLSRSPAGRISLDQGRNPCLLHWAGGFFSIGPPGKSSMDFYSDTGMAAYPWLRGFMSTHHF